jgi:DNA-binding IclR family transcriptional regulator
MLLALQAPSVRQEWLDAAGVNRWSPARKRALEQRLRQAARRGYAEYANPMMKSVLGVSAAICDTNGHAIAAVTSSFAQLSGNHPTVVQVRRMVMLAAAKITREIGGVQPRSSARSGVRSP